MSYSTTISAHGGGLDEAGGHHNRKTGGYHCHREPCLSTHKQVEEATGEAGQEEYNYSELYNREDWTHWIDEDSDCQDTRAEILIRDSEQLVVFKSDRKCKVESGLWTLPYTIGTVTNASQIDIDHIIPLKWAHGHGGDRWSSGRKQAFANDPANLLATSSSANRSKGTKGPDEWMPKVNGCSYAQRWGRLIEKYGLLATSGELTALGRACQ